MTLQDYLDLKNGSDVRGVACDGTEENPVTLTTEAVSRIAKAFCVWLISKTGKTKVRVAVGYDSRSTSLALCDAATEGITATGHDAVVTGLSSTPSMFRLLRDENRNEGEKACHGAIMITASHLPADRNGLKFFSVNGGLDENDISEILGMAYDYRFAEPNVFGEKTEEPYLDEYAAFLTNKVRTATDSVLPLAGKHIIVDASNGVGGFFAAKVLAPLGADISGSQCLEPDGRFPNHIPNPENKEAMDFLRKAVLSADADLGIIFDTDADRAAIVDKNGEEINRNRLIALVSAILLAEKPGTIVTDSVTSDGLAEFIAAKGGKQLRFKRGYKNVITEAMRLNAQGEYAPLAIETSGHAAFAENDFLDDGAYLAARLLIALSVAEKEGKTLSDLIADLQEPVETAEIRLHFSEDCDKNTAGKRILDDLQAHAQAAAYATLPPDNYEGCRIAYDEKHGDGWALVRVSLHEAVLPVNAECKTQGGLLKILKDIYYVLKKHDYISVEPLEKAIAAERQKLIDGLHARLLESPVFLDYIFPRAERKLVLVEGNVPAENAQETENKDEQATNEQAAPSAETTAETESTEA